jgi:hypothetical protein
MAHITAVFFDGAGLLIPYYFGVVRALEEHAVDFSKVRLGGVSAGAITAMMLALGLRSRDMIEIGEQITAWRHKTPQTYYVKPLLDQLMICIRRKLNGCDLDALARNIKNLHIRVAAYRCGGLYPIIITQFDTFDDLVTAVYGSGNIVPFFNGFSFILDRCGRSLVDGAYSGVLGSIFDARPGHITVSALAKATIYNRTFSIINVIIPPAKNKPIIAAGYRDGWRYMTTGKRGSKDAVGVVSLFVSMLRDVFIKFIITITSFLRWFMRLIYGTAADPK